MKHLSETLSQAVEAIPHLSTGQTIQANISQLGSMLKDGKQTTLYHKARELTPEEVSRAISKASSLKLWQIKHGNTQEGQEAINLLKLLLMPASKADAVFWMVRLIGHFPRRDSSKDAVIISDICSLVEDDGISAAAVAYVCKDVLRRSTDDNPWMPPTGQLLLEMNERMKAWQGYQNALTSTKNEAVYLPIKPQEKTNPLKYGAEKWQDMSEQKRQLLLADHIEYSVQIRNIILKTYGVPDGMFDSFIKNKP